MSSLVNTVTISQLIAGSHPHVTREVTIATGQNLAAGSVLGILTSGGHYKLSDVGVSDGAQTARAVLLHALDTSGGAASGEVLLHGEVDESLLVFGTGDTIADHRHNLEAVGIFPLLRK